MRTTQTQNVSVWKTIFETWACNVNSTFTKILLHKFQQTFSSEILKAKRKLTKSAVKQTILVLWLFLAIRYILAHQLPKVIHWLFTEFFHLLKVMYETIARNEQPVIKIATFGAYIYKLSARNLSKIIRGNYKIPLVRETKNNQFWQVFPFYTPWKHLKTKGFLVFSGSLKWENWTEMG